MTLLIAIAHWAPPMSGCSISSHISVNLQCVQQSNNHLLIIAHMQVLNKSTKGSRTATQRQTVIPEPSFNVPLGLLAIAGFSAYEGVTPLAIIAGLLGGLLTFQATRVK